MAITHLHLVVVGYRGFDLTARPLYECATVEIARARTHASFMLYFCDAVMDCGMAFEV